MIDILVVDDRPNVYHTVVRPLNATKGMRVIGRANTADLVVEAVLKHQPDVVLLNLTLLRFRGDETPAVCGHVLAKEITDSMPGVQIILRTDLKIEQQTTATVIPKDMSAPELANQIRDVVLRSN